MPQRVTPAQAAQLLASPLKYILLDIDGVIWSGSHVIEGVPATLRYLRSQGKEVRFLSNNASLSRAQLQQSFAAKGIEGVQARECYNSAYAAALRLQQLLGTAAAPGEEPLVHGNVFVIGEQGLHDELQRVLAPGFITYGVELHDAEKAGGYDAELLGDAWRVPCLPAPLKRLVVCDGNTCRATQAGTDNEEKISLTDLNPVAVVAGLDKHFNGLKLAYASLTLQGPPKSSQKEGEPGKPTLFIATNEDPQLAVGNQGALLPGAGAMVSALRTSIGRAPDAVCGKPHVDLAKILFTAEQIQSPQTECIMIGDRLTTDVAFGNGAGCKTMLVLSGIEGLADVERAEAEGNTLMIPQYVADSLACFLPQ
ncbi:putative p-nitrophenylphosphatase [Leptomonas pyrrhocoris]|uniref:Putative p-nitrophenylphosphatase n=1 Tax=Leptomonas pyrrhocoris TaxID=157538 RepID=A0A0M9FRH7_LEPPY|nr:putative p-nitrophenylphosphatase [Leptomonas pyrrhocoris]XP_015652825.1 putative p-nitrophenylphosphatase [Leptomonas pyrrhocoris]KPA74385.1 putative p-nitrophenylphosphatase [Leptomonas pyrrhocoris]KPA74386.1 putative p-nitrophenylphosphatase [Leptomonas pyrrhocoris]|eukprot:XP_015652824.1 putative p-nitrophenylphosphatase [Leptomonas pyrrhocoris]